MTESDAAVGRLRILCHAQHLTGVGHAVLPRVLADELMRAHDVALVEGGRSVPRPFESSAPRLVPIPVVQRAEDGALVGEHGEPGAAVLARRAERLVAVAREMRPDVVVIDHYPFSKWELSDEITVLLDAARDAKPDVRVVVSLRDLAPRTRYEDVDDVEFAAQVTERLEAQFDALLIHSDPAFARLEDFFPTAPAGADAVGTVPVTYTGFVVEPVPATRPTEDEPYAVVSTGGIDSPKFLAATIEAFGAVAGSAAIGGAEQMHAFAAFGARAEELDGLADVARASPVQVHPFTRDFTAWLQSASLSISRCGYNTGAALLRSRVPAVVVPARGIADQAMRAARLADRGLAVAVDGNQDGDVDALRAAMVAAGADPPPVHDLDLDGARTTRRILEGLV